MYANIIKPFCLANCDAYFSYDVWWDPVIRLNVIKTYLKSLQLESLASTHQRTTLAST